jgi:hypothetical protein
MDRHAERALGGGDAGHVVHVGVRQEDPLDVERVLFA